MSTLWDTQAELKVEGKGKQTVRFISFREECNLEAILTYASICDHFISIITLLSILNLHDTIPTKTIRVRSMLRWLERC